MIIPRRPRLALIWLLLVAATLLSWALGRSGFVGEAEAAAVLAIALIKVRFVVMEFMELRMAPWPFRLVFDIWAVALWSGLVAMSYLFVV